MINFFFIFLWLVFDLFLVWQRLIVPLLILRRGSLNWFLVLMLSMDLGGFALIFLAEYARILFISFLFCVLFLGSDLYSLFFYVKVSFVSLSPWHYASFSL
jgi:hypothetical protein